MSIMKKVVTIFCEQCIHAAPGKDDVYCEINNTYKSPLDAACSDYESLEI